ncbi:MAG: SRPBCC family protein, partial [Actinobacteria bacterium]|nr:SRPBCC family protein [Actinomycetota bacterium]
MDERAEILATGSRWVRSARIVINSPAGQIFEVIANPAEHHRFDGSGMVQGALTGPVRLGLGSRFGMRMRYGLPYRTSNTVVEFEEGRRIAWCHFNHHRWRYELEPLDANTTAVTETFDGSTARFPPALLLINAYEGNQVAVAKTVVRLKVL